MVLAALAYFGMLNPDRFLPDKISVSDNRIQLISTQANGLIIKNAGSDTLNNLQINMTNHDCKISPPNTIAPGEMKRITLICNDPITPNSRLKGDIKINYSTITYGEIMQKTAAASYAVRGNYFSAKGLVEYWPFDSDANDYSGYNVPGTINGATLDTKGGKVGGAYIFDGNDYISVPSISAINFGAGDFTISAWGFRNTGAGFFLYAYNPANSPYFVVFSYASGNIQMWDGSFKDSGVNPGDNNWFHLVYMRQSGTIKFFINGVQTPNTYTLATSYSNTAGAYIGVSQSSEYLTGKLDEIMIFNRALSVDEIKAMYQSGR
jgi:hypothetical protein